MSSSQLVLAYFSPNGISRESLNIRVAHATKHLQDIYKDELCVSVAGNKHSGVVCWDLRSPDSAWPQITVRDEEAVVWLHYPVSKEHPKPDPFQLGMKLACNPRSISKFSAPLGLITWTPNHDGKLTIVTDPLGYVRLFQFDFQDEANLTVWSTRAGLAHVFGGVQPEANFEAMSGMAISGWPTSGLTAIGTGTSLHPHAFVECAGTRIRSSSFFNEWFVTSREAELPTPAQVADEMQANFTVSNLYPKPLTCDLSGGKDSRVLAAAALTTGITDTLQTINNDSGELNTAKQLVSVAPFTINHRIRNVAGSSELAKISATDYMLAWARTHEGFHIANSAIKSSPLQTIRRGAARINGLGGEAMQGGNMSSVKWKEKVRGHGRTASELRVRSIARKFDLSSDQAKNAVENQLLNHISEAESLGIVSAIGHMDYIYIRDKMPNWSLPFAEKHNILPFLSPSLLKYTIHSFEEPFPYGELHREFLRSLIPSWATIPFYKGSPRTSLVPVIWERPNWPALREHIFDSSAQSDIFLPPQINELLDVQNGKYPDNLRHLLISRVLWDEAVRRRTDEIRSEAASTTRALSYL